MPKAAHQKYCSTKCKNKARTKTYSLPIKEKKAKDNLVQLSSDKLIHFEKIKDKYLKIHEKNLWQLVVWYFTRKYNR